MADIAALGLSIDTSNLDDAARRLDAFANAAKTAQSAASGLVGTSNKTDAAMKKSKTALSEATKGLKDQTDAQKSAIDTSNLAATARTNLTTATLESAGASRLNAQAISASNAAQMQASNSAREVASELQIGKGAVDNYSDSYVDLQSNVIKAKVALETLGEESKNTALKLSQALAAGDFLSSGELQVALGDQLRKASELQTVVQKYGSATDDAVKKTNTLGVSAREAQFRMRNLNFQLIDIGQSMTLGMPAHMVAMQQIPQIVQLYTGPGGLNAAMIDARKIMSGVIGVGSRVVPWVAAIGGSIALMTQGINDLTGESVTMGDVVIGTFKAVGTELMEVAAPAIAAIAPVVTETWQFVLKNTGGAINAMVRGVLISFESLKSSIIALATFVGVQVNNILVSFAQPIDDLLSGMANSINDMVSLSNEKLGTDLGRIEFSGLKLARRDAVAEFEGIQSDLEQKIDDILTTDYAGAAFKFVADAAIKQSKILTEEQKKAIQAGVDALKSFQDRASGIFEQRLQAEGKEIELIQYRLDQELSAIDTAAKAAIKAGADVSKVEQLQLEARTDASIVALKRVTEIRKIEAEKQATDLENIFNQRRSVDVSIGAANAENPVQAMIREQMAQAEILRQQELEFFRGNEEEKLRIYEEFAERKRQIDLNAEMLTREIRAQTYIQGLGVAEGFFGSLSALNAAYGDEQSEAAKHLFAVTKGLALAQAMIDAQLAITTVWGDATMSYYEKIGASVAAATQVATAIANIRSTNLQVDGAREKGGPVKAGGTYLVGEKGPELMQVGANAQITSNDNLRRAMNDNSDSGSSGDTKLNVVINNAPAGATVREERNGNEITAIIDLAVTKAKAEINQEINRGGDFRDTLEGRYGLSQGRAT